MEFYHSFNSFAEYIQREVFIGRMDGAAIFKTLTTVTTFNNITNYRRVYPHDMEKRKWTFISKSCYAGCTNSSERKQPLGLCVVMKVARRTVFR